MKSSVLISGLFAGVLACAGLAEAHSSASWDRVVGDVTSANPQGDVDHYDVYTCIGATGCSAGTFSKTATIPQVAQGAARVMWALPPGTLGSVRVRAIDKFGNESVDSVVKEFDANPSEAPAVSVQ